MVRGTSSGKPFNRKALRAERKRCTTYQGEPSPSSGKRGQQMKVRRLHRYKQVRITQEGSKRETRGGGRGGLEGSRRDGVGREQGVPNQYQNPRLSRSLPLSPSYSSPKRTRREEGLCRPPLPLPPAPKTPRFNSR